jgi:hypothetical protein
MAERCFLRPSFSARQPDQVCINQISTTAVIEATMARTVMMLPAKKESKELLALLMIQSSVVLGCNSFFSYAEGEKHQRSQTYSCWYFY